MGTEDEDLRGLIIGRRTPYAGTPIPSNRDFMIKKLLLKADRIGALGDIYELVLDDEASLLAVFAERMAALAVRNRDQEDLQVGLLAAAIACEKSRDFRDVVHPISLLWRSAELIGLDPVLEFQAAERRLPFKSNFLSGYPKRPVEMRNIQVMRYIESADADGFLYKKIEPRRSQKW
ncbi:hypothetical protein [Frankia sp. Cas3]|uniref:hypothetical protein n=1 Tax=Frankia sp. Cas3 TaxID=3073926 RepID=UPI002AD2F148|nr:hypothetical protein [Frankia sp. Cas3]